VNWRKIFIHFRRFNISHFGIVGAYVVNKYGVEVTFNGITCILNSTKAKVVLLHATKALGGDV
jgi:hypothetical protein